MMHITDLRRLPRFLTRLGSAILLSITPFAGCHPIAMDRGDPVSVPIADPQMPLADGSILEVQPFRIETPYEAQDELTRFRFPRELYEEARTSSDLRSWRITYMSDGLRIEGFVCGPSEVGGERLPVIIYCRGGTADFGAIDASELVTFHQWTKAGFVVLATNYRGGGESEGIDTWCGEDIDDVLNLAPLARSLPFADPERLFLVGLSRGGPMVCGAIKRGMPVRGAAVIAGVSDLRDLDMLRPEFIDGDDDVFRAMGWPGWRGVWPDYERRKDEHLRARSAVEWPEKITVPLLILHAKDDPRVPVAHAERLDAALTRVGTEHALVIYPHDGHSLPLNRVDRDRRIVAWFRDHMHAAP